MKVFFCLSAMTCEPPMWMNQSEMKSLIVKKFEERMKVKIKPYKTPWLEVSAHKTYAQEKE